RTAAKLQLRPANLSDLTQARFASNPLLLIASAIAAGIFLGHYLAPKFQSALIFSIAVSMVFAILSVWLVRKRKLAQASGALVAAFLLAGLILPLIENRGVALNRISRMLNEGVISSGDPVEVT